VARDEKEHAAMPRVCVFDVNETLLDLSALDSHFARIFGDEAARREWFAQMIQSALVATLTGAYADFGTIGAAALQMTAARRGVEVVEDEQREILQGMRALPPHADVAESLGRLRDAGLRLAALTNSTAQMAEEQLAHARLRQFFEQVLSADAVKRLKPAPEPYQMAAERLGVEIGQVRLIAAHAWDIAGALRAGCAAAFVVRPGLPFDPLVPRPDVVGMDLRDAAHQILRAEGVAHGM
jgi:2-haloacid dehalogenase